MQAEAAIEAVYGTLYVCDQLFNLVGKLHFSEAHQTQTFPKGLFITFSHCKIN